MVGAKGLGDEARQAKWAPKGQSRRRAQVRGHSAPHVDRRNRVQLVEEGGCRATSITITGFPQHSGKRRPCRDGGGGEIARFFASSQSERLRLQHWSTSVVLRHHAEGTPLPRREQWARQG